MSKHETFINHRKGGEKPRSDHLVVRDQTLTIYDEIIRGLCQGVLTTVEELYSRISTRWEFQLEGINAIGLIGNKNSNSISAFRKEEGNYIAADIKQWKMEIKKQGVSKPDSDYFYLCSNVGSVSNSFLTINRDKLEVSQVTARWWRVNDIQMVHSLYLSRSELLVLTDFCGDKIRDMDKGGYLLSFFWEVLKWDSDEFTKFAKFHTAWPLCKYLSHPDRAGKELNPLPSKPEGFNLHPLIWSGPIKRLLKERLMTKNEKCLGLFFSFLQGIKRGCFTVSEEFIEQSIVKHMRTISKLPKFGKLDIHMMFEEKTEQLYEKLLKPTNHKPAKQAVNDWEFTYYEEVFIPNLNGLECKIRKDYESEPYKEATLVDKSVNKRFRLHDPSPSATVERSRAFGGGREHLRKLQRANLHLYDERRALCHPFPNYVEDMLIKNIQLDPIEGLDIDYNINLSEKCLDIDRYGIVSKVSTRAFMTKSFKRRFDLSDNSELLSVSSYRLPATLVEHGCDPIVGKFAKTVLLKTQYVNRGIPAPSTQKIFSNVDVLYGKSEEIIGGLEEDRVLNSIVEPVLEPIKVRIITKGQAFETFVGKFIQKELWDANRNLGETSSSVFSLTGQTVCESDFHGILEREAKLGFDFPFWVSGDYSAATDGLNIHFSEMALEIAVKNMGLPDSVKSLMMSLIAPQDISYHASMLGVETSSEGLQATGLFEPNEIIDATTATDQRMTDFNGQEGILQVGPISDSFFTIRQRTGQLMGSIVSFPILCTANLICYWCALNEYAETYLGRSIDIDDVEKLPVKINGDDILFRSDEALYAIWLKYLDYMGFILSLGKNYVHPNIFTINSACFRHIERQNKKGSIVKYSHDFKRVGFSNIDLLLFSQSKDQVLPIWDAYNNVINGFTDKVFAHRMFLHYNGRKLSSMINPEEQNIFCARELGGLGFFLHPDVKKYIGEDRKTIVTLKQRLLASFLHSRYHKFKVPQKVSVKEKLLLVPRMCPVNTETQFRSTITKRSHHMVQSIPKLSVLPVGTSRSPDVEVKPVFSFENPDIELKFEKLDPKVLSQFYKKLKSKTDTFSLKRLPSSDSDYMEYPFELVFN